VPPGAAAAAAATEGVSGGLAVAVIPQTNRVFVVAGGAAVGPEALSAALAGGPGP
jgi:hypothetical protein